MAFSIPIDKIITYPPEALKSFKLIMYEWVDNLDFALDPAAYLPQAAEYVAVAHELFYEAGWDRDGEIRLMWIPPFALEGVEMEVKIESVGIIVWHVKQKSDGLSWILSPVSLPCGREVAKRNFWIPSPRREGGRGDRRGGDHRR
ncbi:hypothetical protein [Chitinophaga agrisoli]|uniref:hypothetical protein n=1 Tax=Chitinophaga agrisoli TaxID=2607653 RepID=UPI001661BDFF|nr:hypothetical protein [Chitinophaga agrisoli]